MKAVAAITGRSTVEAIIGRLSLLHFLLFLHPTHSTPTVPLDINANGMSDVFERHYNQGELFNPANPDHHPDADPDGDGWSNRQESIAGTDPFSGKPPEGLVVCHITHLKDQQEAPTAEFPEGRLIDLAILSWDSLPGKQYTLLFSADLQAGSWTTVGTPHTGNGDPIAVPVLLTDTGGHSPERLFWRVQINDIDSDNDGLSDHEEIMLGLHPYQGESFPGIPDHWVARHFPSAIATFHPDANPSGDGISNALKAQLDLNPHTHYVVGPVNLGFDEDTVFANGTAADPEHSFRPGYPSDLYGHEVVPGWEASIGGEQAASWYIELWDETIDGEGNPVENPDYRSRYAELQAHHGSHGITQQFDMLPDSNLTFILSYKGRYEEISENAFTLEVEGASNVIVEGTPLVLNGAKHIRTFMDDDEVDKYQDWRNALITITAPPRTSGLAPITLSLVPTTTSDGPEDITYGGFVDFLPFSLGLVELADDGSLIGQATPFIEPNLSAPVFEIAPPQIGTATYDQDGMKTTLSFSGEVRSKACDAVRGATGTIPQVRVIASGLGDSVSEGIGLENTIHKAAERVGVGPFAYPFHGEFTLPATPIDLHEGTNVFEIEALDPVSGQTGRIAFAFDAVALETGHNLPALGAGGIALEIETAPDPQSTGTATLAIQLESGAFVQWELPETAPESGVFANQTQTISITLLLEPGQRPIASFNHEDWEIEDFIIPLRETPDGYLGGYIAHPLQIAPGADDPGIERMLLEQPRQVAESGPGETRAYAVRAYGLEHLDDEALAEVTAVWEMEDTIEIRFVRDPETGAVLFADPEEETLPLPVLPRFSEENLDPEPDAPIHSQRLAGIVDGMSESAQFGAGVLYGFGQGGYDLVTGLGNAWTGAVTYAGEELAQGVNRIQFAIAGLFGNDDLVIRAGLQIEPAQQDLQARRDAIATIAAACNDLRIWIKEAEYDLLASLVLRPTHAELADHHSQRLGEKAQMIVDLTATLAEAALDTWENAAPYDKGRYTGLLLFEVATSFVAVTKAGKLSKAEILADIAKRDIDIPGGPDIKVRAAIHSEELATTRMCFVAGTLVLVQLNGIETLLPIEELEPLSRSGAELKAWAKCEHTGIEDWRSIVAFFTTHPAELYILTIDTNDDGEADETITGTGEHPFWVEDSAAFTPMRDLAQGMRLTTARSAPAATVLANTRERAPPGDSFTTYNFEVASFHTYFVGESGVWVHNTGRTCEELFSLYFRLLQKNGGDPRAAFRSLITRMPNIAESFLPKAYKQMGKDVKALGGNFDLATQERRTHILYGDGPGSGGHLYPGQPGKSVFPESWDADKVMAEISELVSDEALEWTQVTGAVGANLTKKGNAIRWKVEGVRDGVTIRVIIEPRGEGIITAFPIN